MYVMVSREYHRTHNRYRNGSPHSLQVRELAELVDATAADLLLDLMTTVLLSHIASLSVSFTKKKLAAGDEVPDEKTIWVFVEVSRQRNTREKNRQIKDDRGGELWNPEKVPLRASDASWNELENLTN